MGLKSANGKSLIQTKAINFLPRLLVIRCKNYTGDHNDVRQSVYWSILKKSLNKLKKAQRESSQQPRRNPLNEVAEALEILRTTAPTATTTAESPFPQPPCWEKKKIRN